MKPPNMKPPSTCRLSADRSSLMTCRGPNLPMGASLSLLCAPAGLPLPLVSVQTVMCQEELPTSFCGIPTPIMHHVARGRCVRFAFPCECNS